MSRKTLLLHTITRLDVGGAQDHLYELISGLRSSPFEQMLLTGKGGAWMKRFMNIPVPVNINPFLIRQINPIMDIMAILYSIYQLMMLKSQYKRIMLHSNAPKAGVVYRIAGFICNIHPNIFTVHGWSFHDHQKPYLRKIIVAMERILSFITDIFITVCRTNLHIAAENGFDISRKSITIYGGIDTERFRMKDKSERIITLGTITNFKTNKRNDIFINIANALHIRHNQLRFIIVGDGPERMRIEAMIDEFGLQDYVKITGFTDNVEQYLKQMDVLVFTSQWEGLPRVLMEAYYSNIPFVAFPAGGIGEFASMTGVRALVTESFNTESMIDTIEHIIEGDLHWSYIMRDEFNSANMINGHLCLYNELQNAKKCRMQSLSQQEDI